MSKKKENKVEVKVVEENSDNAEVKAEVKPSNIYYLKKDGDQPFAETVENERKTLFKYYKTVSTRNNIIMFISVAIFIAAFVLLMQNTTWGMISGWVLVGLTVVGMVTYHLITRNAYPRMSKHYFNTFWTLSNEFLFNDSEFKDCFIDFSEKYQLADVAGDRVYKDVIDIASRNLVHGSYNGKDFTFGELAFYKAGARKNSREVIFVGRHLALNNKLAIQGRYLINIRGEKELDLPNDIDDLVELSRDGNFVIYGLEGSDPVKDLGKDLINKLKSIHTTDVLLNVNVVFWSGRTSVYLSYDDAIVAIPFTTELKAEAYRELRNNVEDVFEILADL